MPELNTVIKNDAESVVGCVFSKSEPGIVTASSEVWSAYLRVQRYEMISTELSASNVPADTTVFIETSTFPQEPTADWFIEDQYTWDTLASAFKYENFNSDARYYRVRILCGAGGDLTDLAWVLGAKHI